jgi:alpha-galactosidase/6-phospho-beta-glucosidase family protein
LLLIVIQTNNNQTGVISPTTEAILKKSKYNVYLAMLADPVIDNAKSAEKTLNAILDLQKDCLGYLK